MVFLLMFAVSCSVPDQDFHIWTSEVTEITATSATCGGTVQNAYGNLNRIGVCWSTNYPPRLTNGYSTNDGIAEGTYTSYITNLAPNTNYNVSAYAIRKRDTIYGGHRSFKTSNTAAITICQSYGGGIVFSIDGTGQHGLIAATSDQSTGAEWGCYGTEVLTPSTSGQVNTTAIVNGCAGSAAGICNDLVLNGESDWFLPSKNEIEILFMRESCIPNLVYGDYWCSNAYDASYAWYHCGGLASMEVMYKNQLKRVRCVRAF